MRIFLSHRDMCQGWSEVAGEVVMQFARLVCRFGWDGVSPVAVGTMHALSIMEKV